MSTPATPAPAPAAWAPARVVTPAATATPKSAAVVKLGEILKAIVTSLPQAFAHENGILDALSTIDAFVGGFVPGAEFPALADIDRVAAVEDVTKRMPPGGAVAVATGPAIDYTALARAILAEQRRLSASEESPQP